ncbi:transporter substrate-binding domain-containing protein [Thermomonospora echinospora]|uniref:transporter substrate-binding domain-containing protein n=1 Tax=Thermomonospora echinospora TaxID=1992 RepID=UPI00135CC3A2|nr:transporter substrate-binding domain-containing protein [Thermomonospora echinospora]
MSPSNRTRRRAVWVGAVVLAIVLAIGVIGAIRVLQQGPAEPPEPKSPFPRGSVVNFGLMTDLPGWSVVEPGPNIRSGFQYDLMGWLANEMGVKAVPVDLTFGERMLALQDRRAQVMLANFAITDERAKYVTFAGPYMINTQAVMTRRSGERIRKVEDLAGRTVCTMSDTTSDGNVAEMLRVKVNRVLKVGLSQCVAELRAKRVDAVSTAYLNLLGFAQENPDLRVEDFEFGAQDRFGIGLRLGEVEACEFFTGLLRKFLTSGTWDAFFKKYFPDEPPPPTSPTRTTCGGVQRPRPPEAVRPLRPSTFVCSPNIEIGIYHLSPIALSRATPRRSCVVSSTDSGTNWNWTARSGHVTIPGEWQEVVMPPGNPVLVERDDNLASLVAALARPPVIAVVQGEPGAGKTRLVHEALADPALAARQHLIGDARPSLAAYPLGPMIEALATVRRPPVQPLSALAGALRTVLPDLAGILPPPLPPLEDPRLDRHRLVRAMVELLSKLGPTILVLEDLQWADEATVELLRMIDARPPPRLSAVVTCGPAAVLPEPGAGTVRIRLAPLSAPGARRLAEAVLGVAETAVSPELAGLLHERNGGVPLVVCEDVRLLRHRGLLRAVNGEWVLAADEADLSSVVPPGAGAEIISRVRGLGDAGSTVLEAAAVLAESAEPDLVARVAELDAGQACAALGEATRCGLLCDQGPDGDTVRFRHEVARLAVYQAISEPRRRRLHAAAARELTRTGRSALVVRAVEHHRRAGDVRGWAASAEAAAEIAAADGSFDAAQAQLRDVLRAGAVAEARRAELTIKLGWAALGDDDRSAATTTLLAEASERAPASPEQRAELLLLHLWSALESAGPGRETDIAAAELWAALGHLMTRPDLYAIALTVLSTPNRLPGHNLPMQMSYLGRARGALAETIDPMAHAVVTTGTAHLLLACGDPEGWSVAGALPAHGDRPEVDRQLVRGLADLADAALHLGHYSRGLELVERGRRLAADVRLSRYDLRLHATELRVRWTRGDRGAEEGLAAEVQRHGLPASRLLAAQIRIGQGHLDVARRTLRTVAEETCEIGDLAIAAHAVAELNRVALTAAQRRVGHALARQVLDELACKQVWVWAAPLLPFIPLDLVDAVLPRYRSALVGRDAPLARAALGFAEARMSEEHGDMGRASAGYRRARRRYALLPDPRMAAHACACEMRSQISAGQAPDTDLLRQAWSTFTGLGAVWDANRLKQLMRSAGLPVPHRRGRPGYGNRLSPREREISDLAASGRTNRDIAGDLYLSERTVKYHLANAMRKLQVSSRRELRDALEPGGPSGGPHTCRCVRCGRELNPS